ncbi:MAG: nuclear transport factor 2 family protein [Candidatus Acidiferrales bacterium]
MKNRLGIIFTLIAALALTAGVNGSLLQPVPQSSSAQELTAILHQFMNDAAHGTIAGFDSFFADDVLYTRSTGAVVTKADIMKSLRASGPLVEVTTTFTAEDITIHEYGDTAIVAFRLVRHDDHGAGKPPTLMNYRNTGTFLRRNGHWQAIAWQSTVVEGGSTKN